MNAGLAYRQIMMPALIEVLRCMTEQPLQACLVLVEKRETRYRVQWYYRLFEETQRGLTRYPNNVEVVHGSLLALGELLRHTGACTPRAPPLFNAHASHGDL